MKLKEAPSENWREIADLWQCHDENYDQFIDPHSKNFIFPGDTVLHHFNKIKISSKS